MKYVFVVWIILSVVWWVLALREAKRDRFRTTFPEAVVMFLVLFAALPFALTSVIAGVLDEIWRSIRN